VNEIEGAEHALLFGDDHSYCAHPHLVALADGSWIAVFNRAPRRSIILHPPEDPMYHNVVIRSLDQGRTWSEPVPVPGYNNGGTECAGLTALADGRLMLNQWQFDWYPLAVARGLADQSGLSYPETFLAGWHASPEHDTAGVTVEEIRARTPWVRGDGRTLVQVSTDGGQRFTETETLDIAPYSGGYGMRGGIEMGDGRILLPLSDVPNYRTVFFMERDPASGIWSPGRAAFGAEGHEFEEPAILRLRSGRLLMVLRDNATRHLHQVHSDDGGASWSGPAAIPVAGYPPHLLQLGDGRVLLTYGWRQPDYGIRAVLSEDEGQNWNVARTHVIRGGMASRNLGYPATLTTRDGGFFTIYYGEESSGRTSIQGTRWRLPAG
jgi:hypothetical protein